MLSSGDKTPGEGGHRILGLIAEIGDRVTRVEHMIFNGTEPCGVKYSVGVAAEHQPGIESRFQPLSREKTEEFIKTFMEEDETKVSLVSYLVSADLPHPVKISIGKKKFLSGVHGDGILNDQYRCVARCGRFAGIADSKLRRTAVQMSCLDLLNEMKQAGVQILIPHLDPKNYLITEWRSLFKALYSLKRRSIEMVYSVRQNEGHFICTLKFGGLVVTGEDHVQLFSVIEAAKKMYYRVTGYKFERVYFAVGDACKQNAEYVWDDRFN